MEKETGHLEVLAVVVVKKLEYEFCRVKLDLNFLNLLQKRGG